MNSFFKNIILSYLEFELNFHIYQKEKLKKINFSTLN